MRTRPEVALILLHYMVIVQFSQASEYLGNNQRSGYTDAAVPVKPALRWTYQERHAPKTAWPEPFGELQFIDFDYADQVTIGQGRVYFGSSADHTVRALDVDGGGEQWVFYTAGPVRFAPVLYKDRLCAVSDDGHLYCLKASDGSLIWKRRLAPGGQRCLGNGQMVSKWPCRSGVLIEGDRLYTTAGMWSADGVIIYCLNAATGRVIWKNDTTGHRWMLLPHGSGYGGVSPQGYLALYKKTLYVAAGRSAPAIFDAGTGKLLFHEIGLGYKAHYPGGSWTMAAHDWIMFKRQHNYRDTDVKSTEYQLGRNSEGIILYNYRTGNPEIALVGGRIVGAAIEGDLILAGAGSVIRINADELRKAYKAHKEAKRQKGEPKYYDPTPLAKWNTDIGRVYTLLIAGNTLIAGGKGTITLVDVKSGRKLWQKNVDGSVRGLSVSQGTLIATTTSGRIYCFGKGASDSAKVVSHRRSAPAGTRDVSSKVIEEIGITEGYCLMLGAGDGSLLFDLLKRTKLTVYCLEPDAAKRNRIRALLDDAEMLGTRAQLHDGAFDNIPYAPYSGNCIVWGNRLASPADQVDFRGLYRSLRPWGGVAYELGDVSSASPSKSRLAAGGIPGREMIDGSSSVLARKGRLPIGHFLLKLPGAISNWRSRLVLHHAETAGHLVTDRGQVSFRLFTHAMEPVIVFEWKPAEKVGAAQLQWIPEEAVVARGSRRSPHRNPAPEITTRNQVHVCLQPRKSGGDYTTAWREITLEDGTRRLFISIIDQFPKGSSADKAVAAVERAAAADFDKLVQTHRAWWKEYYPASFLSVPHSRIETFYWIQIYKLGSCIRKGGPLCDLMGPWYKKSRWAAIWWNLNTQMLYSPFPAANRLDMAENLSDALQTNLSNLAANVPKEWGHDSAGVSRSTGQDMLERYDSNREKANLVWACHNLWVQYRCSMDNKFLRDQLYPLLRRAVNTYLHQLKKDANGVLHIPDGHSPESFTGPDTNYDLASLRWGCRTLLRITELLDIQDEKAAQWNDVLRDLAEYAQNDTGYMGGPGIPAPRGHRHWSHLMMIYPYYDVNWDQPENRDLIRRSFEYWSGARMVQAWSQAVMSSMQSSMGNGDGALRHMERSLNSRHLTPNTMHCPGKNPCSETYGGICQMVHDMLIQSWGDKIRIFPGVSGEWKDSVFHNLRAQGAFLVSAVRSEGKTAWARIQSLAGEPCVVTTDFGGQTPKVLATRKVKLRTVGPSVWSLDLKKGEAAVLYVGDAKPKLEIAPLAMNKDEMNRYGLRTERKKKTDKGKKRNKGSG